MDSQLTKLDGKYKEFGYQKILILYLHKCNKICHERLFDILAPRLQHNNGSKLLEVAIQDNNQPSSTEINGFLLDITLPVVTT